MTMAPPNTRMWGPRGKAAGQGQTLKRLFSYITRKYKGYFALVLVCILLSSLAGVAGSLFLQVLNRRPHHSVAGHARTGL